MRLIGAAALLMLAACDSGSGPDATPAPSGDLETAALEAGLVVDPDSLDLEGAFERPSDLGTDRFCAIKTGERLYAIGLRAVFGADSACQGRGTATLDGESVMITIPGSGEDCTIAARFDGTQLALAGEVSPACAQLCDDRASLAGVDFLLAESGAAAARAEQDDEGEPLCP